MVPGKLVQCASPSIAVALGVWQMFVPAVSGGRSPGQQWQKVLTHPIAHVHRKGQCGSLIGFDTFWHRRYPHIFGNYQKVPIALKFPVMVSKLFAHRPALMKRVRF